MGVGGVGGNRHIDHSQAGGADEASLPRTGWSDSSALSSAVDKAKASVDAGASRPNHKTKWVDAKRVSSGSGDSGPPASLALASAKPPKHHPTHPVITAKYGVPGNWGGGGGTPNPVIVAKYGVPGNWGGGGGNTHPVITAKYGVPANHGGGTHHHPVIVAKYGVPGNWGHP